MNEKQYADKAAQYVNGDIHYIETEEDKNDVENEEASSSDDDKDDSSALKQILYKNNCENCVKIENGVSADKPCKHLVMQTRKPIVRSLLTD